MWAASARCAGYAATTWVPGVRTDVEEPLQGPAVVSGQRRVGMVETAATVAMGTPTRGTAGAAEAGADGWPRKALRATSSRRTPARAEIPASPKRIQRASRSPREERQGTRSLAQDGNKDASTLLGSATRTSTSLQPRPRKRGGPPKPQDTAPTLTQRSGNSRGTPSSGTRTLPVPSTRTILPAGPIPTTSERGKESAWARSARAPAIAILSTRPSTVVSPRTTQPSRAWRRPRLGSRVTRRASTEGRR